MASVPVTSLTRDGVADPAATAGDTTNGMTVSNGGNMFLRVSNTDTVAQNFEIDVPGTIDGQTVGNRTYSLAAGVTRNIGPWPVTTYGNSVVVPVVSSNLLEFRAYSV